MNPANRITDREPGPDTRALAAAGRRVGLASVVLALCVPLLLPGLHPSKLFSSGPGIGGSGGSGTGAGFSLPDTLSQTLRELQAKHPTTVLFYTTTAAKNPPYLQTYVYDDLSDSGWHNSNYTAGESQASTIPAAQGLLDQAAYRQIRTTVTVAGDALDNRTAPTFLAMPYPATQVTTPPGIWLADNELMVFSQYHGASAQRYQATSVEVAPTSAQLKGARKPTGLQADLALPASYQTKALKQIADEHTAGQSTEYDKVNALAAWLSGPAFAYSAAGAPVELRGQPVQLPDQDPPRGLRPVGVGDDGPDPAAWHSGPAGGRLHRGHPYGRKDLRGQDGRRARMGPGVLLRLRLDQLRGHPAGR